MADLSKIKLNGTEYELKDAVARAQPYYGVCETAATTVAKTVTVDSTFILKTGAQVTIKFTNTPVYQGRTFTLNVNDTGAKNIVKYGSTGVTSPETSSWYANSVVTFTYDGSYWLINNFVGPYPANLMSTTATQGVETVGKLISAKVLNDAIENKLTVTNTLESGALIATINGTDIYAPEGGSSGIATETDPVFSASAAAGITAEKISAWDAKSDFSGSYNDLSDKPTIPTVPTNVSAFTNDAGYLTSYTETDPTVPSWAKASTKPTYTATEVGAAASSHVHGNVKNDGTITVNTSMANGDRLLFSDTSDSSKIKNTSITIGTSTTQYLANNGTWQNLPTISVSQTLTSGTEIGSVNSTKLYAPTPYDDSALAARVTALEQLEWATYYSGRSNPSNSQGQNGDIYLQY